MKAPDWNKMMKNYQPVVKKTGAQLSKALKTAEEDISKMYRIAQAHVEIQMKNLQKEKLYHELGKHVAGKLAKGDTAITDLDKFKKRLDKINSDGEKMKKKLSRVSGVRKRKRSSKKK